jgi:probable phosphoglycerate mutase
MTLTLTLVRHGQTQFNVRRVLQGSANSPLTRDGHRGVRTTAQHLAGSPFIGAYTSPAGRARRTASGIVRHHPGLPLWVEDGLREYDFGVFEERPEAELEALEPWAQFVPAVLAGRHPGLPGGESGAAYMARVTAAFSRIISAHDDGEILVVGHGLTLAAYLWTVQGGTLPALPNASVSTVEVVDRVPRIVTVGLDVAGHDVAGHDVAGHEVMDRRVPAPHPIPAPAP